MKNVKENKDNTLETTVQMAPGLQPAEKPEGTDRQAAEDQCPRDTREKYSTLALAGIILAVAAWVVLSFKGEVALGLSIASFISACFGLKASTRAWRNTAITAIVSSTVLMVVLSAFLIVIYIGLDSL